MRANKYINIYSMKMAGYLLLKGFIPEKYQKSHKDSERTIFFFLETSEFNRLKNFDGNVVNI